MSEKVSELLPCPFCGGTDIISRGTESADGCISMYIVKCKRCGSSSDKLLRTKAAAETWWNTRRADIVQAADAETVRDALEFMGCRMDHDTIEEPCPICRQVDKALAALSRLSAGKRETWISVKDRLPGDDNEILYYGFTETIEKGRYNTDRKLFEYWGQNYFETMEWMKEECLVTHWMPLPPPPSIPSEMDKP
jgi:Lar family restriction alleviation protein